MIQHEFLIQCNANSFMNAGLILYTRNQFIIKPLVKTVVALWSSSLLNKREIVTSLARLPTGCLWADLWVFISIPHFIHWQNLCPHDLHYSAAKQILNSPRPRIMGGLFFVIVVLYQGANSGRIWHWIGLVLYSIFYAQVNIDWKLIELRLNYWDKLHQFLFLSL
jgi:hypothetical protein